MNLELKRPIAVFDLETTGININSDRIVEIAIIKVHVDGRREQFHKRVNPLIPIPLEVSEIHGIFDKDIADAPSFKDIAQEVIDFIGDADLAGYNSNKFDIPVLAEELIRNGFDFNLKDRQFVDVQNIFHKMEQRTLSAAYQFYCDKSLENAHSALYDTEATLDVLLAQLGRYTDLKKDVDFLSDFSKHGNFKNLDFAGRLAINEKGEAIYNFGKHKGKTISQVNASEPGYYGWMLDADFPLYTKKVLKEEMERLKAAQKNDSEKDLGNKLEDLKNKFSKK
ncbi:MAG: 3'-5' exonuclease [Bacteroidota bacterium]